MTIPDSEVICGHSIAAKCDYVFSQASFKDGVPCPYIASHFPILNGGEIIFCKTDFLNLLHQCISRFVPNDLRFSIVTHDSDYPLDDQRIDAFENRPICWWGMNCESSKGNGIPIGIANSYSTINMREFSRVTSPTKLLYVNNRIETFPTARRWVYDYFSSKSWATVRQPYDHVDIHTKYKAELMDHKFIVCPRGNGVDTHRIWEALYSGVIPIVVRHRTHSLLEGNLPILFVNSYDEVNESLLQETYDSFSRRTWNDRMLTVSWWIQKIREGMNHDESRHT